MSTMDDIAAQRQRLNERMARIDAERLKVTEELGELDDGGTGAVAVHGDEAGTPRPRQGCSKRQRREAATIIRSAPDNPAR